MWSQLYVMCVGSGMGQEANEDVMLTKARCLYTASFELQIGEFVTTLM